MYLSGYKGSSPSTDHVGAIPVMLDSSGSGWTPENRDLEDARHDDVAALASLSHDLLYHLHHLHHLHFMTSKTLP